MLKAKKTKTIDTIENIDSVFRATYIDQKDYFKAEDLYFKYKHKMSPIWRELYEAERLSLRNQHAESNKLLEDWLKVYSFKQTYAKTNSYIISLIFENLIHIGDEKLFNVWYKTSWEKFSALRPWLQQTKTRFEQNALMRVDRSAEPYPIPLDTLGVALLKTKIKVNNTTTDVILDTGCVRSIMTKATAEKLGVTYKKSMVDVNRTKMKGGNGIIDSIEIGGVKVYNIPVTIIDGLNYDSLPDSIKQNPKRMKEVSSVASELNKPVIGYPVLELIGKLEFDFELNTLSFPQYKTTKFFKKLLASKSMNLMKRNNALFIQMQIEEKPTTLLFDTGFSDFIGFCPSFYEVNKNALPLDSTKIESQIHFAMHNVKRRKTMVIKTPLITFEGRKLKPKSEDYRILIIDESLHNDFKCNGTMGYSALKSFGKRVLLDLENVELKVLEE